MRVSLPTFFTRRLAVLTLGRAAERYPDHPYAYVALGRVWLEIAQARSDRVALSKALGALEGAVGSDDSSEALMLFGRALLMTSDEETAERMLQDATERRPVEPLAFYYLAEAAERLGHFSIARNALLDYDVLRGDEVDERRRSAHAARLGDLSLKLNEPVIFQLTTQDVVMGFSVPDFAVRATIVPGQRIEVPMTPTKIGEFTFLCDVFCGSGHENMEGTLRVMA